ncbi:MBL fold metallo-hydrolase [Nocardia sp. NPDC049149]|uniref:MBL fold metallo-hydrolase n=1 Tax=Nocardia sp. NPDC049149 TaxID=3364315 RepID=UPI003722A35E
MTVYALNTATLRPHVVSAAPTQCLLVERDNGLLAVDAGLSRAHLRDPSALSFEQFFIRRPHDPSLALVNQIRALGYRPEDLTDIVLTHLHSEHASGIMDFPHATVHVSRTEHDVAMNGSLRSRMSYRPTIWAHHPNWRLHSGTDIWKDIPGVSAIDHDIYLVPLPGHTLGHCGVAVRVSDTWILHAGDATYLDPADQSSSLALLLRQYQWLSTASRAQSRTTHQLLRDLSTNPDVRILCSHHPAPDLSIIH